MTCNVESRQIIMFSEKSTADLYGVFKTQSKIENEILPLSVSIEGVEKEEATLYTLLFFADFYSIPLVIFDCSACFFKQSIYF